MANPLKRHHIFLYVFGVYGNLLGVRILFVTIRFSYPLNFVICTAPVERGAGHANSISLPVSL